MRMRAKHDGRDLIALVGRGVWSAHSCVRCATDGAQPPKLTSKAPHSQQSHESRYRAAQNQGPALQEPWPAIGPHRAADNVARLHASVIQHRAGAVRASWRLGCGGVTSIVRSMLIQERFASRASRVQDRLGERVEQRRRGRLQRRHVVVTRSDSSRRGRPNAGASDRGSWQWNGSDWLRSESESDRRQHWASNRASKSRKWRRDARRRSDEAAAVGRPCRVEPREFGS